MSPIHRACEPGSVTIDVGLLQHIESAFWVDCVAPPDVIAPLVARIDAEGYHHNLWDVPADLLEVVRKATDGSLLELDEIHAVQQLRGWHRQRYGNITIDAYWLAAVRNVLDGLTLGLAGECDTELEQAREDGGDWYHPMLRRMIREEMCGDCKWCQAMDLRDRCDAILDAAGFDGSSRYRAYAKAS